MVSDVLPQVSAPDMKTIAQFVRRAVLGRYRADSCIESTAIFIDVLAELGVASAPVPVLVTAYNRAAQDVLTHSPGLPMEQWPEDAWTVGQVPGQTPKPGGWPGHLVAVVDTRAATRLVDVSADQMSRPGKGLVIPGPVLGRPSAGWAPGDVCVTHLHETGVVLRWERTDDTAWADTLAWVGVSQMTRAAATLTGSLTGDKVSDSVRERGERADGCVEEALAGLAQAGIVPGVFTAGVA